MTRNEFKTEAKWAIIEKLEEGTEEECLVLIDRFKEKMEEEGD